MGGPGRGKEREGGTGRKSGKAGENECQHPSIPAACMLLLLPICLPENPSKVTAARIPNPEYFSWCTSSVAAQVLPHYLNPGPSHCLILQADNACCFLGTTLGSRERTCRGVTPGLVPRPHLWMNAMPQAEPCAGMLLVWQGASDIRPLSPPSSAIPRVYEGAIRNKIGEPEIL